MTAQETMAAAIDAIPEGISDGSEPLTSPDGAATALSLPDILKGEFVANTDGSENASEETKTDKGTLTPTKPSDATAGQTEAKADTSETTPEAELQTQYAGFGKQILEEWQTNPAQVAKDFFEQMGVDAQRAFLQSIGNKGPAKTGLPENYEPQNELEDVIVPLVGELQAIPQFRSQIANITEAVTNQQQSFGYAAAHVHSLEAKVDALSEILGVALESLDLDAVLQASQKAGSYKEGVKKVLGTKYKAAVEAKQQASKTRPLDASQGQAHQTVIKNGTSAVSILKQIMEAS